MSNIPSQNPWNDPRNVRPYDPQGNPFAEPGSAAWSQPARSGSGCALWIVLGGIGTALVAFATVLVLMGAWAGRASVGEPYSWQQLQQEAAAVYATPHQEPSPGRSAEDLQLRSEVERLMQRIELAARHDDGAAFVDCVDVKRFTQRLGKLTGQPLLHWHSGTRREIASQLSVSDEWSRLMLVEVVKRPTDSWCVAYTFGWGDEDQVEIRWWLIEDGSGWKVYDWQRLDLGMSEVEHWAEVTRLSHLDYQHYDRSVQQMETSDELYAMGEFDEAIDRLREIRPSGLPDQLADFIWLTSAYRLRQLGEMEMAREYSERLHNADRWPGSHYSLMEYYRATGDYERALHHGRQYEKLLGPSPALNTALAEIHRMRGEHDEALAHWQKVMRIEPDSHALDWLVTSLPVDRLDRVLSWLERNEHAYDVLSRLAPRFGYSNPEGLARVSEFANEHHPGTAVAAHLKGLQHQRNYEDEEAARYFHTAFQAASDAEDTTTSLHAYLDAMTWTGRAAEAYRQLGDVAVFEYYVDDFEYFGDIDRSQFREVLAEHRRRRPGDPRGYYHAGVLARQERQYDEAERELREALRLVDSQQEPSYIAEMVRYELIAVLDAAGRWREAYALHDSSEQFQQLADVMVQQQRWEDLEALIDLHSASHPDDSWLDLYRGVLLLELGNFAPAVMLWKEVKASLAATDNERHDALQWRIQHRLRQAYLDDDLWREAYEHASDRETAFEDIARDLQFREAWETLEQLITLHEQSYPGGAVIQKRSELLWNRGDYREYVEQMRDEVIDELDLDSWRRVEIDARRVRALLRLGRFEEARRLVGQLAERDQNYLLQSIVPIVQGDVAEATQTVREALEEEHVFTLQLFIDEDAGPRLWEDEFAELRREIVPELPYSLGTTVAGVLLQESRSLNPHDVQLLIADRFEEPGEVRTVTDLPSHLDRAVMVCIGDVTLWFATGVPAQPLDQQALKRILPADNFQEAESSGMWLFAGVAAWQTVPSEARDAGWDVVCQLAQDNASAVLLPSTEGMLPADESTLAALPDPAKRLRLAERALPAYTSSDWEESRSTDRKFDRQLHLLAQDFLDGDREPPLEVCFHVEAGLLREEVWLRVEEIDRPMSYRFAGPLLHDCRLIPLLRQGEPLRLEQFEVAAWRRGQESAVRTTSNGLHSQTP